MINGIVNKIKSGAEKLDHSVSQRSWGSSWYLPGPWFIPKAVYGAAKYSTRLTIKGFLYAVNLEQTWKYIRSKIPFGNPDVYFDVKANKTTSKDYGTRFDPIMKKNDHGEDIRVKVPKYKLPQRSVQQFEAWLESGEEDKGNKDFVPKSSAKKKLSNDEQKAYNQLIELYEFIKRENGTIKVEGGQLVIKIDIANKTKDQIKEKVIKCFEVLNLPFDKKMIETITERLYKKAQDQAISSDQAFAKTKQQQTASPSRSMLPPQDEGKDINGETIEEYLATKQDDDSNIMKNTEPIEQIPDIRKEEQVDSSMHNNSQFSLTIPNVISLQLKKDPNELQSDLISRHQPSSQIESNKDNVMSKAQEIASEDLQDVSVADANAKLSNIPRTGHRRSEEVSRG